MSDTSKFADLKTRFLSAIAMVAIGATALWFGGWILTLLIVVVVFAMHWEMGRMLTPLSMQAHWFSAVTSAIALIWVLTTDSVTEQIVVVIIATLLQRVYFHTANTLGTLVSLGIIIGALLLIYLRTEIGIMATLWIIGLVVITDIAGYFVGRIVGGAKFWPAFSPKKNMVWDRGWLDWRSSFHLCHGAGRLSCLAGGSGPVHCALPLLCFSTGGYHRKRAQEGLWCQRQLKPDPWTWWRDGSL